MSTSSLETAKFFDYSKKPVISQVKDSLNLCVAKNMVRLISRIHNMDLKCVSVTQTTKKRGDVKNRSSTSICVFIAIVPVFVTRELPTRLEFIVC